jgi:hypothetical protein
MPKRTNFLCTFSGCDKAAHARKFCIAHYRQWRLGLEQAPRRRIVPVDADAKTRIAMLCVRDPATACWIWTASKNNQGYGRIRFQEKEYLAHRLSYIAHIGDLLDSDCVCHRCDTPLCVNPSHLFIGTHKSNAEDKVKKRRHPRHSADTCLHGHPYADGSYYIYTRPDGRKLRRCRACLKAQNSTRSISRR